MKFLKTECTCQACQSACEKTPGWFRPGEAEKAAKHLGMTLKMFFETYLGVNWWEDGGNGDVFVLAPAIVDMEPGREYPGNPRGQCVFFEKGRCKIHPVKPYECAHGNPHDSLKTVSGNSDAYETHKLNVIVKPWRAAKHQKQIRELLGREPETESFSFFDMMFGQKWRRHAITERVDR